MNNQAICSRELDEVDYKLLASVKDKPRYLHMGKTPVGAIQKCWELCDMKLLEMDTGNWIYLTDKGKEVLRKWSEF